MTAIHRVVHSQVEASLEARLTLEDGSEVVVNLGDLLHCHGRVADVIMSRTPGDPHVSLPVILRGTDRGYRGVVHDADRGFLAYVQGRVIGVCSTAREAAIRRMVELTRTSCMRKRSLASRVREAQVKREERGDEEEEEVVYSHEVTREERDAHGRQHAIVLEE